MIETASYDCPHCGESVTIALDWGGGSRQEYVEDCQVCCRPNVLRVTLDSSGDAFVTAEPEDA